MRRTVLWLSVFGILLLSLPFLSCFRTIDQNAKVIVIGSGKDGLPLILGGN